ncbi:MAG: type II/III secretion system protein [Legionella sp. 40-6]|nr:type II/III secretion system protein [Legionella sp.]OJY30952.1 MAG: type II/III secretion system protein [Legionella sp. 40-6]
MKWGWILVVLMSSSLYAQNMITKVIPLQYIPAEKAIQLMQPLLQPGESLSGSGQTLMVKVNDSTLTQIRSVLHQIDIPPVTFHISVHQGDPQWLSSQNDNAEVNSTQQQAQLLQDQSVNVMSGDSALVALDQEVPIVTSVGGGYFAGITYQQHQIHNGFLVRPVLRGSQVQLSVRRLREQANPAGGQQFDSQKVDTTVMVPLNKWVSLANPEGAQDTDNSSSYATAGNTFAQQATVYIKVSIVNNGRARDENRPRNSINGADGW